jgi:Protein of unknown function (DUF2806)
LADDENASGKSLATIKDLLGVGQSVSSFIASIERGVGAWWRPYQIRREGKAQREEAEEWLKIAERYGFPNSAIEASITERGFARVVADGVRHQRNREAVAEIAVEEFKALPDLNNSPGSDPITEDWIEQFWNVAERFSDKNMQTLFGRILATASKRSNRYSPRLLFFLQLMDKREMEAILDLAPFVFTHNGLDEGSESILMLAWGENEGALSRRMMEFVKNRKVDFLSPLGLFNADGWAHSFYITKQDKEICLCFNGYAVKAKTNQNLKNIQMEDDYRTIGSGDKLTQLGREVFGLCAPSSETKKYVQILIEQLDEMGFESVTFEETSVTI